MAVKYHTSMLFVPKWRKNAVNEATSVSYKRDAEIQERTKALMKKVNISVGALCRS